MEKREIWDRKRKEKREGLLFVERERKSETIRNKNRQITIMSKITTNREKGRERQRSEREKGWQVSE